MYFALQKDRPQTTTDTGTVLTLLAADENMTMLQSRMPAGRVKKAHSHAPLQGMVVLSGKMKMTVGTETCVLEAGDTCIVPPNVSHETVVLEETTEIEIFVPARPEMVAKFFPDYKTH